MHFIARDNKTEKLRSHGYALYVLAIMIIVLSLSSADRQVYSILLQQIKDEFSLTDSQSGLLGGLAFGILYATVGVPLAWIADRASRRNIISIAMMLWTTMTCLCGLANVTGNSAALYPLTRRSGQ